MALSALVVIILSLLGTVAAVLFMIYIMVPLFKGIGWLVAGFFRALAAVVVHVARFVGGMIGDTLRAVGALLAMILIVPLILGNIVIGRWSASAHFGRVLQSELATIGHSLYRVVIGHPARFLLLHHAVEGIEQRIPEAMAKAPGRDAPRSGSAQFEGYAIVGSLRGGGSGGRLYVADPSPAKLAAFARAGREDIDQVVIKSFSLQDGSSLPQIVRESRALEAARKIGLVLEHEMTEERFFYVMPYVPGEDLTTVTRRLHIECGAEGLDVRRLRTVLSYVSDLMDTLHLYHKGGLWHKDIKPDNIIVSDGRAHLVDLGLITPLRSAMTLTTHGTEYFRDPELVRMALRGVKVHEVDGVKFDVYGAGAVLFSVVENSFPAHGGLSQITRRCPESLRWVIRRSMTDLGKRYGSAEEMKADLAAILHAPDPMALKPAELPSMRGGGVAIAPEPHAVEEEFESVVSHVAASPRPGVHAGAAGFGAGVQGGGFEGDRARVGTPAGARVRRRPKVAVMDWLTGRYEWYDDAPAGPGRAPSPERPAVVLAAHPAAARRAQGRSRPAHEQLKSAHARVRAAQERAHKRMGRHGRRYSTQPNAGVAIALFVFLGACIFLAAMLISPAFDRRTDSVAQNDAVELDRLGMIGGTLSDLTTRIDGIVEGALQQVSVRTETTRNGAVRVSGRTEAGSTEGATSGSALVLSDLPLDMGTERRTMFDAVVSRLRDRGWRVRGLQGDPDSADLRAKAAVVVRLGQPTDPDAVERLRDWLATGEAEGVDAVLWIGRPESPEADPPYAWIDRGRSELVAP